MTAKNGLERTERNGRTITIAESEQDIRRLRYAKSDC